MQWVRRGGMVVTTSSAATADELDQESTILSRASGLRSVHNGRTPQGAHELGPFGPAMKAGMGLPSAGLERCAATQCHFTALGEAGSFVSTNGTDIASWLGSSGGGAAIRWAEVDAGVHVHFAWLPGVTHTFSGAGPDLETISTILANLTSAVGVVPAVAVDSDWIEAPLLHGPSGSVMPLLNWTDHGQDNPFLTDQRPPTRSKAATPLHHGGGMAVTELNVSLGYIPSSAVSVKHGALTVIPLAGGMVHVAVPLDAVDFVLFRR